MVRVRVSDTRVSDTRVKIFRVRVRAKFRLRVLRWHGHLSASVNKKMQTLGAVMTGVCPSFRVGVSFRAILLSLILNWLLLAH